MEWLFKDGILLGFFSQLVTLFFIKTVDNWIGGACTCIATILKLDVHT